MAEKFMKRNAIIDLVKSEHRANALRRRAGLTRHPLVVVVCGCPDPNCGGSYNAVTVRTIPTSNEADESLATDKAIRRASERVRRANAARKKRKRVESSTSAANAAPG